LCVQNFLAGAAGLAAGIAFIRGLAKESSQTLGNFWVDLTRSLLWILLPGSLPGALLLVAQGVPMNFHPYVQATSLEGRSRSWRKAGRRAGDHQESRNQRAGSSTPMARTLRKPHTLTNLIEMLAIVLLPRHSRTHSAE